MKNFDELAEKWPSAFVSRDSVPEFTGGLISSRYMANLDSLRKGPKRIRCGRKIGYPVKDFVEWMNKRINLEVY